MTGSTITTADPLVALVRELREVEHQVNMAVRADDTLGDDDAFWRPLWQAEDAVAETLATTPAGIALQVECLAEWCRVFGYEPRQARLAATILAGLRAMQP